MCGVTRGTPRKAIGVMGDENFFDFPKPVRLIRHFLRIADTKDDIILDVVTLEVPVLFCVPKAKWLG